MVAVKVLNDFSPNLILPTISKVIEKSKATLQYFGPPTHDISFPYRMIRQHAVLDASFYSQSSIKLRDRSFDAANIAKPAGDVAGAS